MSDYKQLDSKVIKDNEHGLLLTRVDSANTFQKLILNETDDQYFIASHDVKIDLMNGHFTDGIEISICRDAVEDDPDSKTMFLNIVISDVLGTFVSSWY